MIYEEKKFFDPENQWDRVPEWGDVAEHTDEAAEVLDATTKTQLWDLALKVDVMNDNKEEEFADIDALFWAEGKINQLDDAKKNDALKYALKDAKIKMWSWEISVIKIAELFWKYVSQDGNWWRLSVSEIPEGDDKQYEEALKSLVSSPTQSPLAYLIQKTSNFAKIQAENGYGRETEANKLREIREDKALGNQTRRALAWLRSWVEWWKIEDEKIPDLKVDDVLKMKYISKETMEAIKEKSTDENVKKLWDDLGKDDSKYEYRVPYTNNYALKEKWKDDIESNQDVEQDNDSPIENTEPFEGNLPNWIWTLMRDHIRETFGEDLKTKNNDKILVNWSGTKTRLSIETWTYPTIVNYEFDLKECLKADWNFHDEYIKKTVLEKAKESLVNRKKAIIWKNEIKSKQYSKDEIFWNDQDIKNNPVLNTKIDNYFKTFSNYSNKLNFDEGDTTYSDEDIKLVINNYWSNADYNKYQNNAQLIIKWSSVVNDEYKLDETALKWVLKDIVINIAKEHF